MPLLLLGWVICLFLVPGIRGIWNLSLAFRYVSCRTITDILQNSGFWILKKLLIIHLQFHCNILMFSCYISKVWKVFLLWFTLLTFVECLLAELHSQSLRVSTGSTVKRLFLSKLHRDSYSWPRIFGWALYELNSFIFAVQFI